MEMTGSACGCSGTVESLASYRRCAGRLAASWPGFMEKRAERLVQRRRYGTAAEKVAENILEDLFTMALDWRLSEVNNQVGYADLVLTRLGVKLLIAGRKRLPNASRHMRQLIIEQTVQL